MYDYSIAMLPITVRVDTDQKYQRYEVPGMELSFIPENDYGHKEFTVAFLGGGKDGLAFHFVQKFPRQNLGKYKHTIHSLMREFVHKKNP